jgi:hypothetical protein
MGEKKISICCVKFHRSDKFPFILHDSLICNDFDARESYDRDGGSIVSYHWDFSDGSTAEGSTPDHTFPQGDKIYNVTLMVTDNDGASETASCLVKIDNTMPPETKILHRRYFELQDWYSKLNIFILQLMIGHQYLIHITP